MKRNKTLQEMQRDVLSKFKTDIYQLTNRTWLNSVEIAIQQGLKNKKRVAT